MKNIPTMVKVALGFICGANVLSMLSLLALFVVGIQVGSVETYRMQPGAVTILVVSFAISITLIVFMIKRQNWARLVYSGILAFGLIMTIIAQTMPNIIMVLEMVGTVMLYTKDSNVWFTSHE